MSQSERRPDEYYDKRANAAKEIAKGVIKFCVGAFFGATAAYVTRDFDAPKFERYSVIAGGTMVGLYIGGQASNQMCLTIDSIAERMKQIQNASEEER